MKKKKKKSVASNDAQLVVRVPKDLLLWVKSRAKSDQRTLAGFMRLLLQRERENVEEASP